MKMIMRAINLKKAANSNIQGANALLSTVLLSISCYKTFKAKIGSQSNKHSFMF